MNSFPPHSFLPAPGSLSQWIVEDPSRDIPPHLSLSIDIPFLPFTLDHEEVSTSLWIGGLDVPVRHWRELAHAAPFPDPFELDGIVRLFSVANPVEVESLRFGEITGHSIAIAISCQIDFESESHEEYGIHPCSLSATLQVGPLRVSKAIEKRFDADPLRIHAELEQVVDLHGYGPLEKAAGAWQYPLLNP